MDTYAATQGIKYNLKARNATAIKLFGKPCPSKDPTERHNVHQHQAVQSQAAYKCLLTHHIIEASGNCIVRDETKILDVLCDSTAENDTVVSCADISIAQKYTIDSPTCIEDHN